MSLKEKKKKQDSLLKKFFFELKERNVISNYANINNFFNIKEEEKIVYLGIDCTAESLHIGHLFLLIQSFRFVKEGFKVIFLLGGATSKIGDPSDKLEERKKIDIEKLKEYQQKIEKQLKSILFGEVNFPSFSPLECFFNFDLLEKIYEILGINLNDNIEQKWEKYYSLVFPFFLKENNNFTIKNNIEWFQELNCIDFFDVIGRDISVNYLLSKGWVKRRKEIGISFLAFSYSLFQAYDFCILNKKYGCFGQLGGSDQWGNMTTGLKLLRAFFPNKKFFVVSFNLLTDKHGKKLSKSEKKGTLFLNTNYNIFFDFFCNLSDEKVQDFILKFTFLNKEQIEQLKELNKPPSLRILQRILLELLWLLNFKTIVKIKEYIK